jgi:cyclic beta-1,2-glucan synthetase
MLELNLRSNGKYHVVGMPDGSASSYCDGMAVTRWLEDAALAGQSGLIFFHTSDRDIGASSEGIASVRSTSRPVRFEEVLAPADALDEVKTVMYVAVACDAAVELRRVRFTNHSSRTLLLTTTSFAEVVLAPATTDAAHPAFSKLFLESEIDETLGAILVTRRPSLPKDEQPWLFSVATSNHIAVGKMSFETDRMRFVGRGRTTSTAEALEHDRPLSGRGGAVLDTVAAIRVPIALEAGASAEIDWFTGVAHSRLECEGLVKKFNAAGAGNRLLAGSNLYGEALLERIGASKADGRLYERLAASVVRVNAALRADATEIASNRRGQSSLWKFGLSGDVPIVLLEVAHEPEFGRLQTFLRAHAFWSAHGIQSELIILISQEADGRLYEKVRQLIFGSVQAEVFEKRGGVFLHDLAALDDGDRVLMRSVARIVIDSSQEGVLELLDRREHDFRIKRASEVAPARPRLVRIADLGSMFVAERDPPEAVHAEDLLVNNGFGGLEEDLREYVFTTSGALMTPAPWVNLLTNPEFGSLVSESGSAYTWSENAHEFRLSPWSNDSVSDPAGEAFYIRDEATGLVWSPTLLPTRSDLPYVVRHGFGYSTFEHTEESIESELCMYVAIDAPVKFCAITLRNRSSRQRRLSITGYVEWVLGDERAKTMTQVVTEVDKDTGSLFARNGYNTDFEERIVFFDVDQDLGIAQGLSVCGDRSDFFGPSGSRAAPAAMTEVHLSGRLGAALDPCGALRVALVLDAGEARKIVFRLGVGKTTAEARALVARWRGVDAARDALESVHDHWRRLLGAVQVHSPDATVDALSNGWLLYQVVASRLWGRTGFSQSSGAFGFRDQLQDVMALVHADPALVRSHLLLCASRQFREGDVQHWWHPPSGKGVRTRCSDDYLWLALVTSRYVEVTGDESVLDVQCPFLDGSPLKEGEQSSYFLPVASAETASLYEHCVRAIRRAFHYGEHGLPLIGMCDWNDGMSLVGVAGRGESVWLALFLIAVLKRFAPLATSRLDVEFATVCADQASGLSQRVQADSWDGAWYRRAYFDDGAPLGSSANAECKIDSISQSWAVLSAAVPVDRARMAMESVDRLLVQRDAQIVQLISPPFDLSSPSPGYIQGYVPGVRENGGQYTHAAVWAAIAFAELGNADRAWELFAMLNPFRHGDTPEGIRTYKIEPYVVAGDVYAFAAHAGRGGWAWYTGAAGWMYQLLVESLLGLKRRGDRLRVEPLLPRDWPGFDISYRFGGTRYEILCRASEDPAKGSFTLDGIKVSDSSLQLIDDGKHHRVHVHVQRRAISAAV